MAKHKTSRGRRMRRNVPDSVQTILDLARRSLGWADDSTRTGLAEIATAGQDGYSPILAFDSMLLAEHRLGEVVGYYQSLAEGHFPSSAETERLDVRTQVAMHSLLNDYRRVNERHGRLVMALRPVEE